MILRANSRLKTVLKTVTLKPRFPAFRVPAEIGAAPLFFTAGIHFDFILPRTNQPYELSFWFYLPAGDTGPHR